MNDVIELISQKISGLVLVSWGLENTQRDMSELSLEMSFHTLEVDMVMNEAIINVMVMRLFNLCGHNKIRVDLFFLMRELIVIPYLESKGK